MHALLHCIHYCINIVLQMLCMVKSFHFLQLFVDPDDQNCTKASPLPLDFVRALAPICGCCTTLALATTRVVTQSIATVIPVTV